MNIFLRAVCLLAFRLAAPAAGQETPVPLIHGHAHNDYEHPRPLFDALDRGFCSIEADVYLVEGQLLVAHDRTKARPERTLEALYLEPLRERARQNGGRAFRGGPSVTLLVDVKSDANETYTVLREVLRRYEPMLTIFRADKTETNAVTVVVSGNRAREVMLAESVRLAGYDGRLADWEPRASPQFMPLVSDNWALHFAWRGDGPWKEDERTKLKQITAKTHQRGIHLRFWGVPEHPAVWRELLAAGVDLISTDELERFQKFSQADAGRTPGR